MKRIILIVIFGLSMTSCNTNNESSEFDINGKWKIKGFFNSGGFTFDKEGFATFGYENNIVGGKKYDKNGKTYSLEYKVEYNKEPKHLDLIFTNLDSGTQMTWRCIFEIINENKIKFARGGNNEARPTNFTEIESITLKRIK